MPGRTYRAANTTDYRFSINGQEKDTEINKNITNALYWEYDGRIGRRWNIDPIIKPHESPFATFYGNPILNNDPLGDDPPKKPGFWTRFFRAANNDYYKTRAEEYAHKNKIDEKNIIDVGKDTWVIIDNKNSSDIRYSIFRKARPGNAVGLTTSPANDDLNLTTTQLLNTQVQGNDFIDAPIPAGGASKGLIMMGSKSKNAILGVVDKVEDAIESFKRIRFGVSGHPDVLNKGFHLHFDDIAKNLELGLRPINGGKIGLIQVGKLSVGTANDIKKAVELLSKAMANPKFRSELLVRLKVTQEYLQQTFKGTTQAQQAIDKAHEVNYLIKSVLNY